MSRTASSDKLNTATDDKSKETIYKSNDKRDEDENPSNAIDSRIESSSNEVRIAYEFWKDFNWFSEEIWKHV